ncbi:hypothetical protein CDV52_07040 [Haematobacter missouriensis]|uniref:Uncharacterized protein n=1 Tax=Haematobacter missouriensis TaxID=366616 RepID=A0A212ATD3_9RHOB|nr:hypothetical protein CDV52_07040 [Haematobacter missouriensis]
MALTDRHAERQGQIDSDAMVEEAEPYRCAATRTEPPFRTPRKGRAEPPDTGRKADPLNAHHA